MLDILQNLGKNYLKKLYNKLFLVIKQRKQLKL